jgi:hypothetical protein
MAKDFDLQKMKKMPFNMDFFLHLDKGSSNGKSFSIRMSKKKSNFANEYI